MGDANVLAGALLVGLVILDTALVTVSRLRRGVTLVTGGRDHLSHRLLLARARRAAWRACWRSCRRSCARARSSGIGWAPMSSSAVALAAVTLGVLAIAVLDTARWRPAGIAVGTASGTARGAVGLTAVDRQ